MTTQKAFDTFLRRALHDDVSETSQGATSGSATVNSGHDSSNVFWGVNFFLLVLLIGLSCYCWRFHKCSVVGQRASDLAYQQVLQERRRIEEEKRKETPEKRQAKLLASFERNQVTMVRFEYLRAIVMTKTIPRGASRSN
jgi:hypothetical protein